MIKRKRVSKLEEYQDVAGKWRWRVVAPNGKIVSDSCEGYENRVDMRKGQRWTLNALVRWAVFGR